MELRARPEKRARVDSAKDGNVFAADLTTFQLRQALRRERVALAGLTTKAQLVARYQQLLQDKRNADRDARVRTELSCSLASPPPLSSAGSKPPSQDQQASRRGLLRMPTDVIADVTQALRLRDVAALASACRALNSVASPKLKGQPSPALWRRRDFDAVHVAVRDTRGHFQPSKTAQLLMRALNSMPHLEVVRLRYGQGDPVVRAQLQALLHTSGPTTLRRLEITGTTYSDFLLALLPHCPRLQSLELAALYAWGPPLAPGQFPALQSLTVMTFLHDVELFKLLAACPNLRHLSLRRSSGHLLARHMMACGSLQSFEYHGSLHLDLQEQRQRANEMLRVLGQRGPDGTYPMPALQSLFIRHVSGAAIADFRRARSLVVRT